MARLWISDWWLSIVVDNQSQRAIVGRGVGKEQGGGGRTDGDELVTIESGVVVVVVVLRDFVCHCGLFGHRGLWPVG